MRERCTSAKSKDFRNYGGRGITVCKRWLEPKKGFINFFKDMGNPPEGHSLDRKNVNKGYSKANCRWSTFSDQLRNRRKIGVLTTFTHSEITEHVLTWGAAERTALLRALAGAVQV
ncbi:MAG TPA: hypothetical protein VKT73_15185 [Xanthobacteraceae bacterium]|nr:hypothetical protein [Xanthobacteraceae bacterium]